MPFFCSLQEAARTHNCSIERIRYYIEEGHFAAYVDTPPFLTTPLLQDPVIPTSLDHFWQQPLAKRCRMKLPITWREGYVTCSTIIVTDTSGEEPTPSDLLLSKSDGRIGPGGEFYWRSGWHFKEKDLTVNDDEVQCFKPITSMAVPRTNEKECNPVVSVETDEELCDRLRNEGRTNKEIARQLIQKNPSLSRNGMYKLVLEKMARKGITYRTRCRQAKKLLD